MAVQQLSSILDSLGDSIPLTKEAYGGRKRREEKGTEGSPQFMPCPSCTPSCPPQGCCTAHPQGGTIYTGFCANKLEMTTAPPESVQASGLNP